MTETQTETSEDQFPEAVNEAVQGLLWLGHLEDSFEWCGHSFVIRTLRAEEELLASRLTDEYKENIGQPKAWQWAHVALCLESVDGDVNFCPPISPDKMNNARARFNYVTQWYPPVGVYLFGRYANLAVKQAEAIEAIEDLSAGSLPTSQPSADSLKEWEDLIEATSTQHKSESSPTSWDESDPIS